MRLWIVGVLLSAAMAAQDSGLTAGFGQEDITPPLGLAMAGYGARTGVSNGVHEPLYVRSLLVEQGQTVVLMTVSVIGVDAELVQRIRARVEAATGIPAKNILVSATHTHSGPDLPKAGEAYLNLLVERSAASAVAAWKNRFAARVGIGAARVEDLGRNRRRLLYGGAHPDPQVGLIKIEDARGKLRGVAFNYGCHPTVLDARNLEYTEDWPYYAMRALKASLGEDVWTAYYQSAEGDINIGYTAELSAIGAVIPTRTWAYAELKGRQMMEAVRAALAGIETRGAAEVESVTGSCRLPLRTQFPDTLEQAEHKAVEAERRVSDLGGTAGARALDQARADAFLARLNAETARWFYGAAREGSARAELQVVRIGEAVFAGVPGEVFSEIGLKLKQRSPYAKTFVIGLANGYPSEGYLPTAAEYREGGYEVVGTHYSEEAEKVLLESSLELIRRLGRRTSLR